ncbi:MAG: hypothetical protein VX777_01635 [Chlamydiota bacterium]|nr:hypothetical protein [Chlamydiota bacterium]
MKLHYESIADFGYEKLSNVIRDDKRATAYKSTNILADKINKAANTAFKGYVALSEENKVCGFVMFTGDESSPTITDAFTCEHFIGKGFFKTILSFMKDSGFAKPAIVVDDNASDMKKFISEYGVEQVWV